jgi:hypothetical protein
MREVNWNTNLEQILWHVTVARGQREQLESIAKLGQDLRTDHLKIAATPTRSGVHTTNQHTSAEIILAWIMRLIQSIPPPQERTMSSTISSSYAKTVAAAESREKVNLQK